ncbi:oligosaccharide flippase family protein [Citrobacter freundii]|uniref:oligosaccharide flippase family protein n=1 Tax=Citrobacter freundii TaxID=546 RepID=UPI0029DDEEA8|nr:oligosaccharide flippase family protein [Citrobacter freundii]MDX7508185.1 oligosaccharide flippase family protein [Citrobacter freundii]
MTLLKDSMIYLIGEIFSKLFPFLLLPYLTRQLGPAEYGSLSYFMAVITLLSIIIGLVQQDVVSRFYFFYGNKSVYNILFAGITLSTIMYMSVVSIGIYFKHPVLSLLATVALFQSLLQAGLSLLQCQKKAFNYVLIQSLVTLIGFFATLFFFEFIQKDAEYRIISLAIGNAIGYLILLFFLLRRKKFKIKPLIFHRYIIHAICYAAPLIIHHLSYYVKGQFDRVFINNHFSSAQLGVYSAGLQLSMILPVLNSDYNNVQALKYYIKISRSMGLELVVKVHPAERNAEFINKIKEIIQEEDGVYISNRNTFELILGSKCVGVNNSTVGFEAIICGKETFFIGKTFYSKLVDPVWRYYYIYNYLINIDSFTGVTVENNIISKLNDLVKMKEKVIEHGKS